MSGAQNSSCQSGDDTKLCRREGIGVSAKLLSGGEWTVDVKSEGSGSSRHSIAGDQSHVFELAGDRDKDDDGMQGW